MLNVQVNDRDFLLVHAMPYEDNGIKNLYYGDVEADIEQYVWMRNPYCHVENKTVIVGHDIVQIEFRKKTIETDGQWYDIDLGLAMNNELSRLAVLCLDDLSVKYYDLT